MVGNPYNSKTFISILATIWKKTYRTLYINNSVLPMDEMSTASNQLIGIIFDFFFYVSVCNES